MKCFFCWGLGIHTVVCITTADIGFNVPAEGALTMGKNKVVPKARTGIFFVVCNNCMKSQYEQSLTAKIVGSWKRERETEHEWIQICLVVIVGRECCPSPNIVVEDTLFISKVSLFTTIFGQSLVNKLYNSPGIFFISQ